MKKNSIPNLKLLYSFIFNNNLAYKLKDLAVSLILIVYQIIRPQV
jgi:hypothetical protein